MTDDPRIEFPCDYPIRVIGVQHATFREQVVAIARRHAPDLADASVNVQQSRDGTYCSVRFTIVATGEDQLKAMHRALMDEPGVRMVL